MMAKFSKRALKQSVLAMPIPQKSAVLPPVNIDNYAREKKARRYIIRYGLTAAAFILVMVICILAIPPAEDYIVPPNPNGNPQSANDSGTENKPQGEGNIPANRIVITAYSLDVYKNEIVSPPVSDSTSGGGSNANSSSSSNGGTQYPESSENDDSSSSSRYISVMLKNKMKEYEGQNVWFRVVVKCSSLKDVKSKLEYAQSIGAMNITENENLPENSRIMELTAAQIEQLAGKGAKIYLAASDEFYSEYYNE